MPKITVVLPCYNEEESLPLYFKAVDPVIKEIPDFTFDFVLVNDGSKDKTLEVMNGLYLERNDITVVSFSRNFGQNAAFSAGLKTATGDYVITMDSDLQDPVYLLKDIAARFKEGYEVVSPHRADRKEDSWFKRTTAKMFYRLINKVERKEVLPENVNCFRGLSRRAVNELVNFPEKDRFLITEIPLLGFKTCQIDFSREKRQAGKSKYNVKKMFTYAFDNLSNGTARPLYAPIQVGAVSSCFFFLSSIALLICYLLGCFSVMPAYPEITVFMILSFLFLSTSLIIFVIGILSLYEHNILINTRGRPTYLIDITKRPEDKKK
jgi:glycosyltransferase involved in cell wall biosynthesis